MNRLWLGCLILLTLLAGGIFVSTAANNTHGDISALLSDAAQAAMAGQWDTAADQFFQAKDRWQQLRPATAAIADHAPMEEIDRHFSRAEVYLHYHSEPHFSAACRELSMMTEAVGEAQQVSWWSLM